MQWLSSCNHFFFFFYCLLPQAFLHTIRVAFLHSVSGPKAVELSISFDGFMHVHANLCSQGARDPPRPTVLLHSHGGVGLCRGELLW
jgi:hypothetical protein